MFHVSQSVEDVMSAERAQRGRLRERVRQAAGRPQTTDTPPSQRNAAGYE